MTDARHASFSGSVPAFYDRHLGPVLFEPYARDLAARLPVRPGLRVLEAACGTGIVTRRLLERLPQDGAIVATDLNAAMIDHGRASLRPDPRLEWRVADVQALPFADASFDVVAMQFGIMFVPDKDAALREMRRVLRPGGTALISTWDSFARNPFARLADEVVRQCFPEQPPTFYRTPFGDHDPDEHRQRARRAGFTAVRVDGVAIASTAVSASDFATGLVHGNPIAAAIAERGSVTHAEVEARVAAALQRELGDGPVRVPLHAWVVTAAR